MKLKHRIIAEKGTRKEHIDAAAVGLDLLSRQLHVPFGITALKYDQNFPTLETGQVDARVADSTPAWDGGGVTLWLTSRDLSIRRSTDGHLMNYIFGISYGPDAGQMVASGHRLDVEHPDEPVELLTTIVHEGGHTLGLVEQTSPRHDAKYGFSGHCKNDCTMEAANSRLDTIAATSRLSRRLGTAGFCGACLEDLDTFGSALRSL